jgi:hypothetical protein
MSLIFFRGLFKRSLLAFVWAVLLSISFGCKDKDSLGGGLLDDPSGLQFSRLYKGVRGLTERTYASRTDQDSATLAVLGTLTENPWGTTEAGFYTGIGLPFPNNLPLSQIPTCTVDSLVVQLRLKGYYGFKDGSTGLQRIRVYRLASQAISGGSKQSNFNPMDLVDDEPLVDRFIKPNADDFVRTDLDSAPVLRFRLPSDLARQWLADTNNLKNNPVFRLAFRGLVFVAYNPGQSNQQGGLVQIDLKDAASKMALYLKFANGNKGTYLFRPGNDEPYASYYRHRYPAGGEIEQAIADTNQLRERVYVQGLDGLKARVYIPPGFFSLRDSLPLVLNQAQLVIPAEVQTLAYPARVLLTMRLKDGQEYQPIDAGETGAFNVLGYYAIAQKAYIFNLTRELHQRLYKGQKDYGIYLYGVEYHKEPARVMLKTGSNMRLVVKYTRITN